MAHTIGPGLVTCDGTLGDTLAGHRCAVIRRLLSWFAPAMPTKVASPTVVRAAPSRLSLFRTGGLVTVTIWMLVIAAHLPLTLTSVASVRWHGQGRPPAPP